MQVVRALLSRMMGSTFQPIIEGRLRFLIVEGSTVQGPGATGNRPGEIASHPYPGDG